MGDEFPPFDEPFPNEFAPNIDRELQGANALAEVGTTVDECATLLAELHDIIQRDVADCINSCHGDAGLCRSCIEGDIARYINEAGRNYSECGKKIVEQVNSAVGEAITHAIGLGVNPPNQQQLEAAANGMPIPEPPVDVVIGDDGNVIPNPVLPVIPIAGPPIIAPPAAGACLPNTWNSVDIYNWCQSWYGFDITGFVSIEPTKDDDGEYIDKGGKHVIPKLCPDAGGGVIVPPKPPVIQPPVYVPIFPGGFTPTGGGGTPTPGNPANPPASGPVAPPSSPGQPTQPPVVTPPLIPADQYECNQKKLAYCRSVYGDTATVDLSGDYCLYYSPDDTNQHFAHIQGDICGTATGTATPTPATPVCTPAPPLPPIEVTPITGSPAKIPCGPSDVHFWEDFVGSIGLPESYKQGFKCGPGLSTWIVEAGKAIFSLGTFGSTGNPLDNLNNTLECVAAWIYNNVIATWFPTVDCDKDRALSAAASSSIPKFIDRWFGIIPNAVLVSGQQRENYLCQYLIPTTREASITAVRGYLSQEDAERIWKLNGDCVPWRRVIQDAEHTRIGIQDAYRLWKLGKITEAEFTESWQRQGIDVNAEKERFVETVQQYPGMADLIRMMVRDVGDDNVVRDLGLNGTGEGSFENKWTGELKTWGEAQGVNDEIARKYWQAHWQSPSPSIIFEWLHRLRPDDRSPSDPFASLVVTQEDARKYLEIADYVPGLIDKYVAVSYRPLTRVDIRRMYTVGAIDNLDDVRRAYRDLGYSDEVARQQTEFTRITAGPSRAALAGALTKAEILNQYKNNLLTYEESQPLLKAAGLGDDQVRTALDNADIRKRAASRNVSLKSMRQRYFMGEFNDGDAAGKLADMYMTIGQANETVELWRAERLAKQKSPTVAVLCKWYGRGMISLDNYMTRVRNLNYNEADALRIVESCQMDIQERRQKEIVAALEKQTKIQQSAAREAAKLLREAKQQARALKLQNRFTHKEVIKRDGEEVTLTITDTNVQAPDVNISNVSEVVDVTRNGQ